MSVPNVHADIAAAFAAGMDAVKAIIDDATIVVALSGEAANYSDATTNFGTGSGKRLASVAVTAADFTSTGSGLTRGVAFAGKAGGTGHVAGNPTVIAFLDGTRILAQISETGSAVVSTTETVTFPAIANLLAFGTLA